MNFIAIFRRGDALIIQVVDLKFFPWNITKLESQLARQRVEECEQCRFSARPVARVRDVSTQPGTLGMRHTKSTAKIKFFFVHLFLFIFIIIITIIIIDESDFTEGMGLLRV